MIGEVYSRGDDLMKIKNCAFEDMQALVRYEFSELEIQLLKELRDTDYVEFRPVSRTGLEDSVADGLLECGLIEDDEYAKHFAVYLTELGQLVVDSMD